MREWKHKDENTFARAQYIENILILYDVNQATVDEYHLTQEDLVKKFRNKKEKSL